jgi:hypothetical protein
MGSHAETTTLVPDALDATITEQSEDQWAHRNSMKDWIRL